MYPLQPSNAPTAEHLHQAEINWLDNVVADLRLRAVGKAPLASLTTSRLSYWCKVVRLAVEACKDDSSLRFRNVAPQFICPLHWDAIHWAHTLVTDAMLEATGKDALSPLSLTRLDEWQEHRANLLTCRKAPPTRLLAAQDAQHAFPGNGEHPALGYSYRSAPALMGRWRPVLSVKG